MNRIATLTVIRGNGECVAYMNGIVKEEMKKLNERHAREMARKNAELDASRGHRNRLLRDNLRDYRVLNARPVSACKRLLEGLETFWCQCWGVAYEIGLLECKNHDEKEQGVNKA